MVADTPHPKSGRIHQRKPISLPPLQINLQPVLISEPQEGQRSPICRGGGLSHTPYAGLCSVMAPGPLIPLWQGLSRSG